MGQSMVVLTDAAKRRYGGRYRAATVITKRALYLQDQYRARQDVLAPKDPSEKQDCLSSGTAVREAMTETNLRVTQGEEP